jgi:hypothetical protein
LLNIKISQVDSSAGRRHLYFQQISLTFAHAHRLVGKIVSIADALHQATTDHHAVFSPVKTVKLEKMDHVLILSHYTDE